MVELKIKLSFLRPEEEVMFKMPARNGLLHHHFYTGEAEDYSAKDGILCSGCSGFAPSHFIYFREQELVLTQAEPGAPVIVKEIYCESKHPILLKYTDVELVSHKNKDFYKQVISHIESLHNT